MRFSTFEFDDSVNQEVVDLFQKIESCAYNKTNLLVGDYVRLYSAHTGEGRTFKCIARRHEMYPDEHGNSQLVFLLSAT
ncbi:MAG TPA: hypothetical protein DD685_13680 [Halomonas sp.]|nr:hypothetical protein [Halomonas sp.]